MKYFNQILFSDINPFEVIKQVSDKCFLVRKMKCTLLNQKELNKSFLSGGFSGYTDNTLQKWNIESFSKEEEFGTFKVRLHKDGVWRDSNKNIYSPSATPIKIYDFNF